MLSRFSMLLFKFMRVCVVVVVVVTCARSHFHTYPCTQANTHMHTDDRRSIRHKHTETQSDENKFAIVVYLFFGR